MSADSGESVDTVPTSAKLHFRWRHVGCLKLAMVGVFTAQKWASTTEGLLFPCESQLVAHLPAHQCSPCSPEIVLFFSELRRQKTKARKESIFRLLLIWPHYTFLRQESTKWPRETLGQEEMRERQQKREPQININAFTVVK